MEQHAGGGDTPRKNWWQRRSKTAKTIIVVGTLVLIGAGMGSAGSDSKNSADVRTVTVTAPEQSKPAAPAETAPAAETAPPAEPAAPAETAGQDNARRSAESYLETSSFSRQGLIEQLSSSAGEGFAKADAIYAVDHINVDWNEQAAKSAKEYLDTSAFSRQGLIEQLSSPAGEGFTPAQAVYGVNAAGL
jgi:hypothetical protein